MCGLLSLNVTDLNTLGIRAKGQSPLKAHPDLLICSFSPTVQLLCQSWLSKSGVNSILDGAYTQLMTFLLLM